MANDDYGEFKGETKARLSALEARIKRIEGAFIGVIAFILANVSGAFQWFGGSY